MGMSAGSSKGINVTPLIDVLLVLLIIFMVSLPILLRMQEVEVPPTNREVAPAVEPVVLKINADTSVTIDETETVPWNDLPARIGQRVSHTQQVFVDFGDGVPWANVLHTVDILRGIDRDTHIAVRMREDSEVSQ
jgi:biopolymer transport protein ExbD